MPEASGQFANGRAILPSLLDLGKIVHREALGRLTFFGGERLAFLGDALENTQAQREAIDNESHDALVDARKRHERWLSGCGSIRLGSSRSVVFRPPPEAVE